MMHKEGVQAECNLDLKYNLDSVSIEFPNEGLSQVTVMQISHSGIKLMVCSWILSNTIKFRMFIQTDTEYV